MSLDEVLTAARQADIRLQVEGDRLVVDAPAGALTPELRDQLVRYKPALLARLAPVALISLRGGLVVPAPALLLALDLERRGFRLSLDAADQVVVIEPTEALTDLDRAGIARWRHHLGVIVAYEAPLCG